MCINCELPYLWMREALSAAEKPEAAEENPELAPSTPDVQAGKLETPRS